jgi:hypothetical protein
MYQHHHHHQMSRKTWAEHLHQLHWNEPRKVTHLAGLMKKWKTINSCISLLQKKTRPLHRNVKCVCRKISRKNRVCLRALRCCSPSRRLLHTISYTEALLKVCSKFKIFISYSFLVINFFVRHRTSCLTFNKSLAIKYPQEFKDPAVNVLRYVYTQCLRELSRARDIQFYYLLICVTCSERPVQ